MSASVDADDATPEKASLELAGTVWRLVNITSMNDTVDVPDDRAKYTLEFGEAGAVSIRADCNRGTGRWSSERAGQLRFGPIASTKALCPPGSLSEKYLMQFQWVRSYVIENEHLFLATMADGSIIEFEPVAEPLAAMVLGEEVRTSNAEEVRQTIITRLFAEYGAAQGLAATGSEIEALVTNLQAGMEADAGVAGSLESGLTAEEAEEVAAMRSGRHL